MACWMRIKKLASVHPPISVAAFPVSAAFTTESSRCQLKQKASTASMTRLFPVPPPRSAEEQQQLVIPKACVQVGSGAVAAAVVILQASELLAQEAAQERGRDQRERGVQAFIERVRSGDVLHGCVGSERRR
ncbi:hypothetical protein PF010_g15286 [Phytophthora fragariae]|uniref:Uncharacterized protein n=1 Tax=Phytophthora fragariae TaxID=53985 RepID=A0A6G0KUD9_9STRA|nr:hypothetical protein PF010_g15286 [Phytophthora fragariae]